MNLLATMTAKPVKAIMAAPVCNSQCHLALVDLGVFMAGEDHWENRKTDSDIKRTNWNGKQEYEIYI